MRLAMTRDRMGHVVRPKFGDLVVGQLEVDRGNRVSEVLGPRDAHDR